MLSVTLRVVSVFLIILMGYAAYKLHWIDRSGSRLLSTIMMNIASPCLVISTVTSRHITPESWDMVKTALLVVTGYHVAAILINFVLAKLLRPRREDLGIYWAELTFANSGFLCFPICLAVFGEEAFFYAAVMYVVVCIFMYTAAIALVRYGASKESGSIDWKEQMKNFFSIPSTSAIIALVMFVLDLHLPEFLMDTCDTVGAMMVPLSMLIIGVQLGDSQLGDMLKNWRYIGYSAMKLLLWPVLTFAVCTALPLQPLIVTDITLTQAMPAGALPVVFAEQYGRNSKLGAELVFISTLLSVITIPIACILLTYYLQGA